MVSDMKHLHVVKTNNGVLLVFCISIADEAILAKATAQTNDMNVLLLMLGFSGVHCKTM